MHPKKKKFTVKFILMKIIVEFSEYLIKILIYDFKTFIKMYI